MSFISRIIARLLPTAAIRHGNSEYSRFLRMPTEILLMIGEHLSPVDLACLALCSHALLQRLGTKSLLPVSEEYRKTFLTRLAQDLPQYFLCHCCFRLHLWADIGPPGPLFQPNKILVCRHIPPEPRLWLCVWVHRSTSLYNFTFCHLQLAMRRHYHGPQYGVSLESLSFTEVMCDQGRTTLLSVDARICSEPTSLCLRMQHWAVFRCREWATLLSEFPFILICDHIKAGCWKTMAPFIMESEKTPGMVFKCRFCNIDFEVTIQEHEGGLALVITKWLDLGSGLTLDDPIWRVHTGRDRYIELGALREAGVLRQRFENEFGPSQDTLFSRNESYLKGRHFTKTMKPYGNRRWILQGGLRSARR